MIILFKSHVKTAKNWLEKISVNVPLSPNYITVSTILFAFSGFTAVYSNQVLLGFLLFLVAGFFDALDGSVARAQNKKTNFGFFLDGVSDRIVDFLFISAFFFLPFPDIPKVLTLFILLFFSLLIPYVKSYADHSRALSHMEALKIDGIFGRSGRVIFFYLIYISFIFSFNQLSSFLLVTSVVLAFITFIQRFYYVVKHHSKKFNKL